MNNTDRINIAKDYLNSGKKAEAKALLSDAVRQDPKNARVWYLLSQASDSKELANYYIDKALVMDITPLNGKEVSDPYTSIGSLAELPRHLPVVMDTGKKRRNPTVFIIAALSVIILISLYFYLF